MHMLGVDEKERINFSTNAVCSARDEIFNQFST